jgi:hypothetical protein
MKKSGALHGAPDFFSSGQSSAARRMGLGRAAPDTAQHIVFFDKKQGAAGITTAAPRIAGQWGRGDNRLPG